MPRLTAAANVRLDARILAAIALEDARRLPGAEKNYSALIRRALERYTTMLVEPELPTTTAEAMQTLAHLGYGSVNQGGRISKNINDAVAVEARRDEHVDFDNIEPLEGVR